MRSFAISFLFGALAFAPLFAFANTTPVANPGGPYEGTTDATQPILFDGSASSDADGDLLEYSWDFGDGSTGIGDTPSHTYAVPGIFTVSLTVNDGTVDSEPVTTTGTISLKPPKVPKPASGAPFISFPLILDWEDVPEAQSYRYELIGYDAWLQEKEQKEMMDAWIKEWTDAGIKDWMENGIKNGFLVTQSQSNPFDSSILKFLEPGQKYLWHAKSCEDVGGSKCGPWGAVWDFTYLLGPPSIDSFSPEPEETNVKLPVTLQWGEIAGAKSYLLRLPVLPAILSLLTEEERQNAGLQLSILNQYEDDACLFTRGGDYAWEVASCLDTDSAFCGPFQQSSFYTALSQPPLSAPNLTAPLFDPAKPAPLVSMASTLSWSGPACAYLYNVKIARESDGQTTEFTTQEVQVESIRMDGQGEKEIKELKEFWQDPKNLDQVFSWQVTPCWSNPFGIGADCALATPSESWKFRISAIAPTLLTPTNNSSTKIPIVLTWEPVEGAASYRYEISKDAAQPDGSFQETLKDGVATQAQTQLEYEKDVMEPGKTYWWHIKTCVDEKGDVCGPWGSAFRFSTFPLNAPAAPDNPLDKQTTSLPGSLSWLSDPGANYYTYQVQYISPVYGKDKNGDDLKETLEGCEEKAGTWLIPPKKAGKSPITSQPNFYLPEQCLGQYRWQVASCLDKDCTVVQPPTLDDAPIWTFTTVERTASEQGLVPCGRATDNPRTPYNEREVCQLKHTGFLLQNLLDFILWKLSLATLLVLAVMTGATSYFSLGGPNALARIKTVFRSFFVGFLILVFAWAFVNIVLMLFGFQFELFGRWYAIPF